MDTRQFILELNELPYDRKALVDIFEQARPFARQKGLGWRNYDNKALQEVDKALAVVIYSGDYMNLDESKKDYNYNFLQHDYIEEIVGRLKFDHSITPNNIDMVWYRPGFQFEPHIDHYAKSTLMWPVIPEDGGAPIDFYYRDDIDLSPFIKSGKPAGFNNVVTDDDIIYTHRYSTAVPTVFNSLWIHGVRPIQQERVYLRLRINETFESIRTKYENRTLFR